MIPGLRAMRAGAALLLAGALSAGAAHAAGDRVALVIGNAAYAEAPLANPGNDARAMGAALERLGFQVDVLVDADRERMQQAILAFAGALGPESTALFYYAGHGVQSRGRNYMIPIGAEIDSERALKFQAVEIGAVLEELEFANSRVNLVVLDACRNNPFERRFRGGSRGLAAIDAAKGTLIAYATAPGSVAADGDGANGLYTEELLRALAVPDLKAEEVFKQVRIGVSERTNGLQVPWESSSLTGEFVFNGSANPPAASAAATVPAPASPAAGQETLFWESIKDSEDPASYEAYLAEFPQGTFASLARLRVAKLRAGPAPARAAPAPASGGCADLSGTWDHDTDAIFCESTFHLSPLGENRYQFAERGCGNATGTATLSGHHLRIDWIVNPICKGHTDYDLDSQCLTGAGKVTFVDSMLLCVGERASRLERRVPGAGGDAASQPERADR